MTQDSTTNDDIALSAYLDGEMPQPDADRLSERLAVEPRLARRLEALRASDDATRGVFARVDALPMPQGVLDLLQARTAAPAVSNVVPFPKRVARQFLQAPVAIAASVALLAGFVAHDLLLKQTPRADGLGAFVAGDVASGTKLHELLESGLSGMPQVFPGELRGEVLLTFRDTGGDYCRQLQLGSVTRSLQAVACRRGDDWQMEALDFGVAAPADGQYQQASGGGNAAVNAAIDALIGGNEALDAGDESRLIQGGWKKSDE
jgi:hypothetical protein